MTEETSNGFAITPEGKYVFLVAEVPKKVPLRKGAKYQIKFLTREIDDKRENSWTGKHFQTFFSWDIKPLLIAMGFEEDEKTKKIRWDLADLKEKKVDAKIIHEPDRDDPDKSWAKMRNITEHIPF